MFDKAGIPGYSPISFSESVKIMRHTNGGDGNVVEEADVDDVDGVVVVVVLVVVVAGGC